MTPREYLYSLEHHGIKLGLDTIAYLLKQAGNPESRRPAVHVAGTNGKGSAIAVLDAIFRAAGYTVARFTSPHLIELRERFLVNGEPIPDETLDENIAFFRDTADQRDWWHPTFFEINTAVAFRWFDSQEVDCSLIEVGLGGRFDATNVIMPEVSAITSIDYDHTRYLGNTLASIAFEKAGIIKEARTVVVGEIQPEPRDVILKRAEELGCPVLLRERDFDFTLSGPPMEPLFAFESDALSLRPAPLGLLGKFQGENTATAVATAVTLMPRFPMIDQAAILAGLANVRWPCRLEKVLDDPPVLIDVAHNAGGARKLALNLPPDCIVLLAVASDKDAAGIIEALAPHAHTFILSQFTGTRAMPVDDLCAAAGNRPYHRVPNLADAVAKAIDLASTERPLLVTGSIFTAGEVRAVLIGKYGAEPLCF